MKHHSGQNFNPKQWERMFAHASLWYDVAHRFGRGFLLYLPVEDKVFSNSWSSLTESNADVRLEKSPAKVRQWFLDILHLGLPRIKDKVEVLNGFADRIMYRGTLQGMPELEIESADWTDGHKHLFHDGLSVRPISPSASLPVQCPESPVSQGQRSNSQYASPGDSQIVRSQSVPSPSIHGPARRSRPLGMTGLRTLSLNTPSMDTVS